MNDISMYKIQTDQTPISIDFISRTEKLLKENPTEKLSKPRTITLSRTVITLGSLAACIALIITFVSQNRKIESEIVADSGRELVVFDEAAPETAVLYGEADGFINGYAEEIMDDVIVLDDENLDKYSEEYSGAIAVQPSEPAKNRIAVTELPEVKETAPPAEKPVQTEISTPLIVINADVTDIEEDEIPIELPAPSSEPIDVGEAGLAGGNGLPVVSATTVGLRLTDIDYEIATITISNGENSITLSGLQADLFAINFSSFVYNSPVATDSATDSVYSFSVTENATGNVMFDVAVRSDKSVDIASYNGGSADIERHILDDYEYEKLLVILQEYFG